MRSLLNNDFTGDANAKIVLLNLDLGQIGWIEPIQPDWRMKSGSSLFFSFVIFRFPFSVGMQLRGAALAHLCPKMLNRLIFCSR